jgi:hypothetical protein
VQTTILNGGVVWKISNKIFLLEILLLAPFEVSAVEKVPTVQLRVLASHIAHKIVSAAIEN